ncbi:hypothetical protein DRO47_01225 [Candidatus Bathyarchaeota archaeon]|nr:MAG: hypothetical protein DRO47_01225 [Candidatus Bathyarchaeota archaeon]
MKRIGIVGAGRMAFARGKAFLDTGEAEIIAVASRNIEHARKLAQKLGAPHAFDDYRRIASLKPDALLVEVPHGVQGEIVKWGIEIAPGILVGAALAVNSKEAEEIEKKAEEEGCLIEAGYGSRYSALWEKARSLITSKSLGKPVMVQSLALYHASPSSWYYREKESGGMPLTHMTYCFINPVRWILGPVVEVSALANRILHDEEEFVKEEMCSATLRFKNGALYSAVAGYISPPNFPSLNIKFICTKGGLESLPSTQILKVYRDTGVEELDFSSQTPPLLRQAKTFLKALDEKAECLNPPSDAKLDVAISEAIVKAARERMVVKL